MTEEIQRVTVGDIVNTSYNTGPYRVAEVHRGCTCPSYLDELNGRQRPLPQAPEHIHIVAVNADEAARDKGNFFLNRYIEEKQRIRSLESDDEIFLVGKAKGQMSLFERTVP